MPSLEHWRHEDGGVRREALIGVAVAVSYVIRVKPLTKERLREADQQGTRGQELTKV